MKKTLLLKTLLLLCVLVVGSTSAWADDETITFSSLGLENGTQYTDPFGTDISVTFGGGGNDGKYYDTGTGIRTYGGGTITITANGNTVTKIVTTFSGDSYAPASTDVWSSDGTDDDDNVTSGTSATWVGEATEVVMTRPSGSGHWRLQAITVYYTTSGGGNTPTISANDVPIAYNATNGSIGYTLQNATGNVSAVVTTGDWLTLGTITSTEVPFTCSANSSVTARTAKVTLSFTGATDKVVTITQAADPNAFNDISDITATGSSYKIKGTVVATNARGFVIGDGTGYVYYYKGEDAGKSVGDKLSINGTTSTYGQVLQFSGSPTITAQETSNYDGNPAVSVVTTLPDYSSGLHLSTYVQFEGSLSKTNSYYDIAVGSKTARISYPTTAQASALEALVNKTVRVKGYFAGNSSSNFTVMLESVEEVVAAAHTLTVNATNGSVAITGKTLISGKCEVAEDAEVTATATPAEHYTFTSWSATGVDITANATANPLTFTMPEGDVTLTATFTEMAKHTATFYVQGVAAGSDANVYEGDAITFPTNVTVPTGYTLVGWTTAEISGTQATAPTPLVSSATMGTADVSYYAVFAIASGSVATLTKMTGSDTFASNDKVVVVAEYTDPDSNTTTNYGMYQETASVANYVNKWVFDNSVETVAADNKKWFTVSDGSTSGTWTLGDDTNGYVYNASSNNLIVSTENATDFTLTWNSTESKFTLVGNGRWLSYRYDLANNYFRMGGATTGTASGIVYFDIYKYVPGNGSYSDYCTTVNATATIPAGKEWITFCSTENLDFTSEIAGLEGAYTITAHADKATTLTATKMEGTVKAGTGLLLRAAEKKTTAQVITIPVAATGEEQADNMLKGVTEDTEIAPTTGEYTNLGLKDGEFHPYTNGPSDMAKLKAGKAYLQVPTAQMPTGGNNARLYIVLDGEATGIANLNVNDNDNIDVNAPMYNLAGQRVTKSYKGVVIVNGKKYINK